MICWSSILSLLVVLRPSESYSTISHYYNGVNKSFRSKFNTIFSLILAASVGKDEENVGFHSALLDCMTA